MVKGLFAVNSVLKNPWRLSIFLTNKCNVLILVNTNLLEKALFLAFVPFFCCFSAYVSLP